MRSWIVRNFLVPDSWSVVGDFNSISSLFFSSASSSLERPSFILRTAHSNDVVYPIWYLQLKRGDWRLSLPSSTASTSASKLSVQRASVMPVVWSSLVTALISDNISLKLFTLAVKDQHLHADWPQWDHFATFQIWIAYRIFPSNESDNPSLALTRSDFVILLRSRSLFWLLSLLHTQIRFWSAWRDVA